jgi:ABC-type transport system involved in cytochrome bd biosynthesis fused ATPase/permease subunit
MALPLTLIELGSGFGALPIAAGVILEVLRSAVRRGLKRRVRSSFMREVALQALDKRTLVPEADLESAFWAAHLTERAIAVDAPALLAATLAGVSILALAAAAVGSVVLTSLVSLVLVTLSLMLWSNQRRAPTIDAVVAERQRAAAWVAAAERDGGEIYGARAREPFLARLTNSIRTWSLAEERLEHERLQDRLLLGALFLLGLWVILRTQRIDVLHLELARDYSLSRQSISGLLLLSTGAPVCYVLAVHIDSLLTAYTSLTQLLRLATNSPTDLRALEHRPARLTARALSFSYPTTPPRPVLTSVDFQIDLSRLTLIIAPNGAGKTTLARLICGVLMPDSGALEVDGLPCCSVSRDDFGFVPQNPLIIETLSIEDNMRLVAPNADGDAIDRLLLELGLQQPRQRLAGELSRGEQRRIAIARAILKEPRLLLLDEPDVWLDADGRALLSAVLDRQLLERAVIVVSHRRGWLPKDASVIELGHQSADSTVLGNSKACG